MLGVFALGGYLVFSFLVSREEGLPALLFPDNGALYLNRQWTRNLQEGKKMSVYEWYRD